LEKKKSLFIWLANRYRVIVRSEDNFAEKANVSFNLLKLSLLGAAFFLFVFGSAFFMSRAIILRDYSAESLEIETQQKLLAFSIAADSLAAEIQARDEYISNIKKIAEGGEGLIAEAEQKMEEKVVPVKEVNLDEKDKMDLRLREEFESSKPEPAITIKKETSKLNNTLLFSPISGIISSDYNTKISHFGVDIVSKINEPVRAVADGTVVISSWTEDTGYIIAIQHENNVISIYKHNSVLLKKVGNFVKGGEIVSIIGNTGELTTGPHLHFELWHKGNPVNPQNYIAF
jgi:murein DD-endopeptidase MepM/ murein hydrolase activator NlpD